MIPLRDENPTRRIPFVTIVVIALNAAAFFYSLTLDPAGLEALWDRWAFVPAHFLADFSDPAQLVTIFTAMFLHAGWLHIIGNMLYLWIFGNNIEDRFGPLGFLAFYLTSGVVATLSQLAVDPSTTIPNLGASGAVAGVLGGYLLLFPGASVVTLIPVFIFIEIARVPAFLVIGFWFVLQLGNGLASLGPAMADMGGVAYFAHIGGFVAGLVLAAPAALRSRGKNRRSRNGSGYRR
jgi:membrane associated rhomboid family serine protease